MDILGHKSRTELDEKKREIYKLMQMIDNVDQLVMLADTSHENRIIYMNRFARETMQRLRSNLNAGLRGADVANALGNPIHQFHRDPDRVRNILAGLGRAPHRTQFAIGDVTFRLNFYPVWASERQDSLLCYMACWSDVTATIEIEKRNEADLERKRYLETRVEQIATAMEEMSTTVNDVAKNTTHASDMSNAVVASASEGKNVVMQAASGMQDVARSVRSAAELIDKLGARSVEINKIVTVIESIAEQTNLLALNAAIEAARAGEQGRGFAVVADEVRKLAERTTKATKEIATMIKEIQANTAETGEAMKQGRKDAESGEQSSRAAEEALVRIVQDINGVKDMIAQIATASEEQAATAAEITRNLAEIAGRQTA
jgi:methyl-accepting chemotaxis protein